MIPAHNPDLAKSSDPPGRSLWLKAASYAYTHRLTRRGWAWEFLRRNKDYVVDWGVAQDEVTILPEQGGPVTLRLGAVGFRMQRWGLIFRRCARQKRRCRRNSLGSNELSPSAPTEGICCRFSGQFTTSPSIGASQPLPLRSDSEWGPTFALSGFRAVLPGYCSGRRAYGTSPSAD